MMNSNVGVRVLNWFDRGVCFIYLLCGLGRKWAKGFGFGLGEGVLGLE